MSPLVIGALVLGYILLTQSRGAAPRGGVPVYTGTPGRTTFDVPSIGRYTSGPGGTQVTLDPSFLTRLLGRTGEALPQTVDAFGVRDTPIFPAGQTSAVWSLGGALDAYRAGERDPVLLEDTLPLTSLEDPATLFPQDVPAEDVTWWYEQAEFLT